MQQLGNRLNISKEGVMDMERRKKDGSITIKSLREVARAMDMQLVYIPSHADHLFRGILTTSPQAPFLSISRPSEAMPD
jgi:hypothetical protein